MLGRINKRVALAVVAILAALGFAFMASGTTSAYFESTDPGGANGAIGKVAISTTGGAAVDNPTFVWNNMLPGDSNDLTVQYTNTGTVPEDVYLTFPNLTALSALNSLGSFGAVYVSVNGTQIYSNTNLNDKPNNGTSGVPAQMLLQQHLAVGHTGKFTFTFVYADKLGGAQGATTHSSGGGVFNVYPAPDGQVTIRPGDGTGSGLPFAVVGVQEGHLP